MVCRPEVALQEVRLHQPCGQLATHKVRMLVDALVKGMGAQGAGSSFSRHMHLHGACWQCMRAICLGEMPVAWVGDRAQCRNEQAAALGRRHFQELHFTPTPSLCAPLPVSASALHLLL